MPLSLSGLASSSHPWKAPAAHQVPLPEAVGTKTIRLVLVLFLLAFLETYSRILGWYDYAVKKDRHVIWDIAWSQKANVGEERSQTEKQDDLRPTALASANSKLKVEG
jgi:hypothetical protein